MRAVPQMYLDVMRRSHAVDIKLDSYLDQVELADKIPVIDGSITYDATADLRRRIEFTVPLTDPQGRSWDPSDEVQHPLNYYGQRLHLQLGVGIGTTGWWWFDHGWFLITAWTVDENAQTVQVTAVDLSQLVDDARLYFSTSPGGRMTYATAFEYLLGDILPFTIQSGVPSGTVNRATIWERERRKNLDDLCNAWGTRWYVDDTGRVQVAPALTAVDSQTEPVSEVTWGPYGTLTARSRTAQRDRIYNAVVVTGKQSEDGSGIVPTAYAEQVGDGPISVSGPFGRRPKFFTSDYLVTDAQCLTVARQMLYDATVMTRSEPASAIPDYALELLDVVRVVSGSGSSFLGRVSSIKLPLTANGGAMELTVGNEPESEEES